MVHIEYMTKLQTLAFKFNFQSDNLISLHFHRSIILKSQLVSRHLRHWNSNFFPKMITFFRLLFFALVDTVISKQVINGTWFRRALGGKITTYYIHNKWKFLVVMLFLIDETYFQAWGTHTVEFAFECGALCTSIFNTNEDEPPTGCNAFTFDKSSGTCRLGTVGTFGGYFTNGSSGQEGSGVHIINSCATTGEIKLSCIYFCQLLL